MTARSTNTLLIAILTCSLLASSGLESAAQNNHTIRQPASSSATQIYSSSRSTCTKTKGLAYPPFSNKKQIALTIKELRSLGINKIRISTDWRYREPSKGKFYWKPLDFRVKQAREEGINILLTIPALGPDWACSDTRNQKSCVFSKEKDFVTYVTALLRRYANVFEKIQFGNEWDLHYSGSLTDFVKFNNILYDIAKKESPNTTVVLGGITRAFPMTELICKQHKDLDFSSLAFKAGYSVEQLYRKIKKRCRATNVKQKVLSVLGSAKYDILDIHLYDDSENWQDYISLLPKNKPIIVSEFGGPSSIFEETNEAYQAKRLSHYLRAIESLPIEEAYYFKLVDSKHSYHKHSGLIGEDLQKKLAYEVFANCTNPETDRRSKTGL